MSHASLPEPAAPVGDAADLPVALVVEDDVDVAYLLGVILTQAGYSVVTAHDGLEGTRLAREHRPVLTTIDIAMPHLDGLEATRRIREFSDSYIVIISTRSEELDILAGFEAGADDYVPKPIRPRELRARLSAITRRPSTRISMADSPVLAEAPEDAPAPDAQPADAQPADAQPAPVPHAEPAEPAERPDGTAQDPDERGEGGKAGMLRVGMQFVGAWIEFRGLRVNPSRGLVVVDDRLVDLHPQHVDLLELMLYSGTRSRSPRELALALRGETDDSATSSHLQDSAWGESLMLSLLSRLGEHRDVPRWIEVLPHGKYRLVRPE